MTSKAFERRENSQLPAHDSFWTGKGFFNYLVSRLSTLNLTVLRVVAFLSISWSRDIGDDVLCVRRGNSPMAILRCVQKSVRVENEKVNWGRNQQKNKNLRMWMCLSCCFWLTETRSIELLIKTRSNEPISSLTSSKWGRNLLMENLLFCSVSMPGGSCLEDGERYWAKFVSELLWKLEEARKFFESFGLVKKLLNFHKFHFMKAKATWNLKQNANNEHHHCCYLA